jgi:cyclopropane-fatty-acyl-phospholipid synthase
MATLEQISDTYDYMDEIFRLSLGETADITCALFNGNFSKSLRDAQRDKHEYVLDGIGCRRGSRILDIGSGWGPILSAARARGAHGIGVTLSPKQAEACARNGLDVRLMDWRDITVETFGTFDGVVSIGAFEHFCSPQEYLAGRQDDVYDAFFRLCHDLLPSGGRLYLQTMMWGRNAPAYRDISLSAPHGSNEYILAVLEKFYPGSFLPWEDQILRVASSYFRLVSDNNGRKDYIETMTRWGRSVRTPTLPKAALALKLMPRAVRDPEFRYKLRSLAGGFNKECFKREVMDHQRFLFEKICA